MTAAGADAPPTSASGTGTLLALAALCVAAFLAAVNFFATSPFYPAMADDLDTTVPLLGQAVTLMLVISAVLGLVVGPLADRSCYRRLLVIGVLAIAANLLGTALTPSYALLLALSIVGALGDALVFGLTIAMASTIFTGSARRRAISWTIASLSVGAILGVPILTTIGGFAGWRVAVGTAGVAAVAVAWLVVTALPPDQRQSDTPFRARQVIDAYTPLLAHPPVLRLLAITVLRSLWFLGLVTYIGAYLGDERGLSTSEIGFFYMLGGAGSTIGSVAAGTRLMATAPRPVIAVANVAGGLLVGLILWSSTEVIVVLLPLATALAATIGVEIASLLSVESPAKTGTTMALNASLLNVGSALGAGLGGALLALGGYGAMGVGLPVFALLAAILALWPGASTPRQPG
jgi:MFS transporter, DHA1 family, inner membrane transport protein